jgi:alginate O-acetyltransferase complex protein AlgI
MDTASFQFVVFGLAAALVSNFSCSRLWRSIVLMLASLLFLGLLAHTWIVLLPLTGFLLLGYGGLVLLERGWSRFKVWSVLAVLLVYTWLKKYTFLPQDIFIHVPYFTVGLSYILFRVLHLLMEAGDNKEKKRAGLGPYLLYTLNFTTFISGPIQRYDEFARDQFAEPPIALDASFTALQLERVVRGFFKVNVLAMLLDAYQQDSLAQMNPLFPVSLRVFAAFKLAVLYPLFLYSNFSGYIDIVIAIARLMRVRLPENFDRPFSASSFIDFWNRWHITLSMWLKTYVYNPLLVALMRRFSSVALQPLLGVFCFFVTFFLIGVWHGRTSEFLVYGVLLGAGTSINKLWQIGLTKALGRKGYKALTCQPVYISLGRGLTFSWFALSLFLLWADWSQIYKVLFAISHMQWIGVWLTVWIFSTIVLAVWEVLRSAVLSISTNEGPIFTSRYARIAYASALGLIALATTVLLSQPAPGIVYKAF